MCQCLEVSRSGYYEWCNREPSQRVLANVALDVEISNVYHVHFGRYGSPRITRELQTNGIECSENRVAKRMQSMGIMAKGKRKFKATTDSKHSLPVFPNLLERDFTASYSNEKWCTDITYVWTEEGWLYLCVFIDLYSRAVIGWSMDKRINKDLVCNALTMALWRRGFPKGVVVHSDRGSQYASKRYRKLLKTHQLIGSMSRKGDCWDNACAESFFHTLKVENTNHFVYKTREQAKQNTFEYIEVYYNRMRKHSSIGFCTPNEYEKLSYNLVNRVVR